MKSFTEFFTKLFSSLILMSLSLIFFSTASHAEIVIALKPDKNPEKMIEKRSQLEAYLSKKMNEPVKVIVPLTSSVIIQGLQNGSIDLGYLSSVDMLQARRGGIADILLAGDFNGKQYYTSYWLCSKDSSIQSVKELQGKPIAFASRTSTSGFLIPYWDLVKQGLVKEQADAESFFGKNKVRYGSGYSSAVQMLLRGEVEAAAVSDYVYETDRYLSINEKAQVRICDTQGPVPSHSIAVRNSLPAEKQNRIKAALLNLNESAEKSLRDELFDSALVEVNSEQHLASTKEALKVAGRL